MGHRSTIRVVIVVDDASLSQAITTLEELDWCLEQLETMQTHKSVSDLASLKVGDTSCEELVTSTLVVVVHLVQTHAEQGTHTVCREQQIRRPDQRLSLFDLYK